jgi:hypothetical protein
MKKKTRKQIVDATSAGVKKELAKPRMSKSARIAELNLDTARIPEQPSTTMSGTVDRSFRLHVRANQKRHKLLLMGPTTGIEISGLKIR